MAVALRRWRQIGTAASVCAVISASGCKVKLGDKAERGRMAEKGPESWQIDGKTYTIGSTYYLVLPPGEQLQYTIEYLVSDPQLLDGLNDERAGAIAMPLMRYAWQQRLFERTTVTSSKGATLRPSLIGVAITYHEGARSRGFRVQRSLDQIAAQR
jgi:hypothetical protein